MIGGTAGAAEEVGEQMSLKAPERQRRPSKRREERPHEGAKAPAAEKAPAKAPAKADESATTKKS
jgi:hypothetical protein